MNREHVDAGLERVQKYTWNETLQKTFNVIV